MEKLTKTKITIAIQAGSDEIEAVVRRAYLDQLPVWLTINPGFEEIEGYITKRSQEAICLGCQWILMNRIRCIEFA